MALAMLKIAVLAPMPRARAAITPNANPGAFRTLRTASPNSRIKEFTTYCSRFSTASAMIRARRPARRPAAC